jgi:P-type Cu+ transporter
MPHTDVVTETTCFHCGALCEEICWHDEKPFCCRGCETVYEILDSNNLCEYYSLNQKPGIRTATADLVNTYAYLDEPEIRKKLLVFESESYSSVSFFIPTIHCVSCIWLLENLTKLNSGILHSTVNFSKKTVSIDFNPNVLSLGTVASLLSSVGYAPRITLEHNTSFKPKKDRSLILKLAIAGFCFGNVMLFSFPEYLGINEADYNLMRIFSFLNLVLSIPVLCYSGNDYLKAAFKSFTQKQINIDVPIAAGLLALFFRSSYDIITATGPGYLDSFTGLVFFLLIGRWFQSKTYESMAFDRDFTAYFPLAVNRLYEDGEWKPVVIYNLQKGDTIKIRNLELIPADSILLDGPVYIDYSFVTGEAKPVKVTVGDKVFAGGRLIGTTAILTVQKSTSQSHLTSLWNNDAFKKVEENKYQKIIDRAARQFTWIVLVIAIGTAVYWYATAPASMWLVVTSVLMVACPCALALAAPFTLGSVLRELGKRQLYLKNADVVERLGTIDAVVFDKTGTITHGRDPEIELVGELDETELRKVKLLTSFSTHPLSKLVSDYIQKSSKGPVSDFKELPGKGIQAHVLGQNFKIGSAAFTGFHEKLDQSASYVFVSIADEVKGYFMIRTMVRKDIGEMIQRLGSTCKALLSGDHETEKHPMMHIFGPATTLLFNQSPQDKLNYIRDLQVRGLKVMMIGDGLNDAGALKQADVGIAVTDDTGVFTPACDGILHGSEITRLDKVLALAKSSSTILKIGFAVSFFYNAIALSFAVSGHLTPLTAAILMPISSISVVTFSTLAVKIVANKKFKNT